MSKRNRFVVALGSLLAVAGCGPGPGKTPEETAEKLAEIQMKMIPAMKEQRLEDWRFQLECLEKEKEWWADRGEFRQEIDRLRAKIKFYEKNLSKMKDEAEFNITKVSTKDDIAKVEVKFYSYSLQGDPDRGRPFFLLYGAEPDRMTLKKKDDKWRIKND